MKLRVGLEKLIYCYLSNLASDVYIEGLINRGLFHLDSLSKARRRNQEPRQSIIKVWIAEMLEQKAS
jgi:hypothetical protein